MVIFVDHSNRFPHPRRSVVAQNYTQTACEQPIEGNLIMKESINL